MTKYISYYEINIKSDIMKIVRGTKGLLLTYNCYYLVNGFVDGFYGNFFNINLCQIFRYFVLNFIFFY